MRGNELMRTGNVSLKNLSSGYVDSSVHSIVMPVRDRVRPKQDSEHD